MATLLSNRGRINLVKNVVKPLYFYLYGKTDMKYEVSVSELTPPPNFSLIPLKIKKLDFVPQNNACIWAINFDLKPLNAPESLKWPSEMALQHKNSTFSCQTDVVNV